MSQNPKFYDSINRYDTEQSEQWRIYLVALLVTLLLHLILFFLLRDRFFGEQVYAVKEKTVELILEPVDPEEQRYVEANPEAPENEPDRKENYSFRSQQAADENANTSTDNKPTVDGDEASQKIVQGAPDQEASIPLEGGAFASAGGSTAGRRQSQGITQELSLAPPAPDFIRQKPEVEEGPGSSLKISGSSKQVSDYYSDTDQPILLYREGSENRQDAEANESDNGIIEGKPSPRKRPTLSPDLVHGPLMRSKGSASHRGALAMDATFSQFGEYEQQFYLAVQAGWYQEIDFFQPIDTSARVVVEFRIQSDGTVDEVKVLQSTAGEVATWICQLALTKRSPFRPWTEEMVQVFGRDRTMKVVFSYR